jgi:hypothetical protein
MSFQIKRRRQCIEREFNYGFGRFVLWHLIFKISGAKVAQVAHWRTLAQMRHTLSLKTLQAN